MKRKFLLLLSLISVASFSQSSIALSVLVDSATNRNTNLQQLQLEIDKASVQNRITRGIGTTNVLYTYGQIDGPEQDYQWQIVQPLGNPLASLANADLQQAEKQTYTLNYALNKAWLKMEVYQAYAGWNNWQKIRLVQTEIKESYKEALSVAEKQATVGDISKVDVSFVKGRYLEAAQLENEALQNELQFVYRLELLTKMKLTNMTPTEPELWSSPEMNDSVSLYELFYQSRQTLGEERLELTGSQFFPSFSVGYFNQQLGNTPGFEGFMLGARLPLFDGITYENRQLAKIQQKQMDMESQQQIWQRDARLQQLRKQQTQILQQLQNVNLEPNETSENIRIINKRYTLGDIDILVLSQSLSGVSAAEINLQKLYLRSHQIQAEINYLIAQ